MRSGLKSGLKGNNFVGLGACGVLSLGSRYKNRQDILLSESFDNYKTNDKLDGNLSDGKGLTKASNTNNASTNYLSGLAFGGDGKLWDSPNAIGNTTNSIKGMGVSDTPLTKGAEVCLDATFDDASKWNITGSPNVSVNASGTLGLLNFNGSETVDQGVSQICLTPGIIYKVIIAGSRATAGQLMVSLGSGITYSSGGNATVYKLAVGTTLSLTSNGGANIFNGALAGISLLPLLWNELISSSELNYSDVVGCCSVYRNTNGVHGLILNVDNKDNPQNFIAIVLDGAENLTMIKVVNGVSTTLINGYFAQLISSTNKGELIVYKQSNLYTVFYVISGIYFKLGSATVKDVSIINNTRHGFLITPSAPSQTKIVFAKYKGQQNGAII